MAVLSAQISILYPLKKADSNKYKQDITNIAVLFDFKRNIETISRIKKILFIVNSKKG